MIPSKTENLFSKATILSHGIIREVTLPFDFHFSQSKSSYQHKVGNIKQIIAPIKSHTVMSLYTLSMF